MKNALERFQGKACEACKKNGVRTLLKNFHLSSVIITKAHDVNFQFTVFISA
jgi:hypothetical protein